MKRTVAVIGFLGVVGCGDNTHPARLVMEVSGDAPAYGTTPFPTDALRDGIHIGHIDGLDRMAKQHFDLIGQHLEGLDGWGLRPTIEFFVQGAIDPDTVPAQTSTLDDALVVLDVDPTTAENLAPIPFDWKYDPERSVIVGAPAMGVQLREATRYAALVTGDIKSPDGSAIYGAVELLRLEHEAPPRWQTTAETSASLRVVPQLHDRIVGLTVFTTQHASDVLVAARNEIANTSAVAPPTLTFDDPAIIFDTPTELDALLGQATRDTTGARAGLEQWGTDNPTGIAHDHIAVVATGKTTIGRFIGDDTGTDGPEDETFLVREGKPIVRSTDTIPITVILPTGAMPPEGFPVIVFGHGLGGSRHDALNIAEPLAAQGYAIVAIDMAGHGSRYSPTDTGNNLGSKTAFTGDRTLRDGFGDDGGAAAYLDFFEGFMNVSAIRDSIRQSVLDFARVAMLVQTDPSLAALAGPYPSTPKLDPTRVAYLGESFGTIVGTDLAAIEPSISLYVLDVPGGGMLDQILPSSPSISSLALPFVQQLYRTTGTIDRFHPLVGALQAVFDGADSLTFARHVLRERFVVEGHNLGRRHVVCIEAMGDEVMPNNATESLARGLNLELLRPSLVVPGGMRQLDSPAGANFNSQTAVLVQYSPATHGYNWSASKGTLEYKPGGPFEGDDRFPKLAKKVTIKEPIYETHAQVAEILLSHFAGISPRVRSTLAPVADFDGDGKPDASDPAPLDPDN